MPVSDRKLRANRANAQKSTGPKTNEGKQRSSQNASTHALFSRELLLSHEDQLIFHTLRKHARANPDLPFCPFFSSPDHLFHLNPTAPMAPDKDLDPIPSENPDPSDTPINETTDQPDDIKTNQNEPTKPVSHPKNAD